MVVSRSVHRTDKSVLSLCAAALCAAAICPAAHALEHITLTTGFDYKCTHHEAVDATHVRLFFPPAADGLPEGSQDIDASLISAVELLPDPPKLAPKPAAALVATSDIPTLIARAGAKHNIDVDFLYFVIQTESGFHTRAVSSAGARGLMQLMPATARTLGVADPFQPDQNINGGVTFLDQLLTRYHDNVDLALAAYNAGPKLVDRCLCVPRIIETQNYVRTIEAKYLRRKKEQAEAAKRAPTSNEQAANVVPPVESAKTGGASR